MALADAIGYKIRTSASRLNGLCDQAAATVKEAEEFLSENGVGTPASVPVPEGSEDSTNVHLGYRRLGSRFRIVVIWIKDNDTDQEKVTPWSDCSRDVKISTIKTLPNLIKHIESRLDDLISEAEGAVRDVRQSLQSLSEWQDWGDR